MTLTRGLVPLNIFKLFPTSLCTFPAPGRAIGKSLRKYQVNWGHNFTGQIGTLMVETLMNWSEEFEGSFNNICSVITLEDLITLWLYHGNKS